MSIERFSFSKSWRDSAAFPTYEDDETQVRDDLQCLHDELADYVNTQIRPAVNETAAAVQTHAADISDLETAVAGVTLGQIPDGSLTAQKLAFGAAAGWEDVSSAVTLTPVGSDEVEVAAKKYFYSRTLGILVFVLQLWCTTAAAGSCLLDQDGYPPAALFVPSTPLSVHRSDCSAFLRAGLNGHALRLWIAAQGAMDSATVCVSGWYFCSGPEVESP